MQKINDDLYHLPGGYVIERGPARVTAIATRELFDSGRLAEHYKLPRKERQKLRTQEADGTQSEKEIEVDLPGSFDALSKRIVEGEEFTFVDWRSDRETWPWKAFRDTPYYSERKDAQGQTIMVAVPYMEQIGEYPTLEAAAAACKE